MSASLRAGLTCIAAACTAAALTADEPLVKDPQPLCPWPLTLWVVTDAPASEGAWRFETLELHDGIARHRSLEAWLAVPEVAEQELRWFVREPLAAVPTFVEVTSTQTSFEEVAALCEALEASGIGLLQTAAGETCARSGGETAGDARALIERAGKRYGVLVRPTLDDERCAADAEEQSAEVAAERGTRQGPVSSVVFDVPSAPGAGAEEPEATAARAVIQAWQAYLGELAEGIGGPRGLASLPPARALVDQLLDLDPAAVPVPLRSDLHLSVAVGSSRSYSIALAGETLERPHSREELLAALVYLGERPAVEARDGLVLLLRRTHEDPEVTSLALRALLGTDPAAARMEALRLLDADGGPPAAAFGVFAFSGGTYEADLQRLDMEDADAVAGAAAGIIAHLAAAGDTDRELRAQAAKILERRTAGTKRP